MARERSKVTVEFIDGEVREYVITASVNIAGYLAQEMQGGALRMSDFDSGSAVVIPSAQIKQIELRALGDNEKPSTSERAVDYDDPLKDFVEMDLLSVRAYRVLDRAMITTVRDLMTPVPMNKPSIEQLKGSGAKVTREIIQLQEHLQELGL